MAATALAVIAHREKTYWASPAYTARKNESEKLERRLKRMTKAELIDFILTRIADDADLLDMLEGEDDDAE